MASSSDGGFLPRGQPVRLRGLFADGRWMCDCSPRMPAERFQTKNGGVNHGRWFYTCQKPQQKRCKFFLWQDDAKPREALVLLNNTHAELELSGRPAARPTTPDIDWPQSEDEREMSHASEKTVRYAELPETPRKEPKLAGQASPGGNPESRGTTPSTHNADVFVTPSTQRQGPATGMITPGETPAAQRFQNAITGEPPAFNISPSKQDSELSKELLDLLRDLSIDLSEEAVDLIKAACMREARKAQGVEKGRDVARAVVREKDVRIAKLERKVADLEAERENHRTIIKHLRKEKHEDG